jgi:hypothetical protein
MRIVIGLIALAAFPAAASDFGPGFMIAMTGYVLAAVWPLLLPLPYLRRAQRPARLYFALTVATFGLLGLLMAPFRLLSLWGEMSGTDVPMRTMAAMLYVAQPLAFLASLWLLPKVRRLLAHEPRTP